MVIGSAFILNAAIVTAKINNLAVTTGKIANLGVTTGKINTLAVTNAKINDLNVDKLVTGTIQSKVITLAIDPAQGDCYIGAGKTGFTNVDAGFIIGLDDSDADTPKLFIGDDTTYLNWDGSGLSMTGTITATDGAIGNWVIAATGLYFDGATDADSAGMAPSDYPFYAGKKYVDRATAPFRVTPAGALVATNATISGAISGATIDIGGDDASSFHVDAGGGIWSGASIANKATAPFRVSNAGALVAASATVTGTIQTTASGVRTLNPVAASINAPAFRYVVVISTIIPPLSIR